MRHLLTDRFLKSAPLGRHNDGEGLALLKDEKSAKWVFRFTLNGRRPEMGLGTYPTVSLAQARQAASDARSKVHQGINPIDERKHQRELKKRSATIETLVQDTFDARRASLKNGGKASNWDSPLRLHVVPKIGSMMIEDVTQHDIHRCLQPIWNKKAQTAGKALSRLAIVFRHAAAAGLNVDTTACQNAKALLGAQKLTVKRIPAMPYQDVPAYYQSLTNSIPDLAMKLLILTACRSAEIRFAHEGEIEGSVWVIPGSRMKNGNEFRVPLTDEALNVLEAARPFSSGGYFFTGNSGKPISDMTLSMKMKRQELEARPHGFRSSFRTWVSEYTDTPREIAEEALSHISAGKIELAYRRTDYLDKRRALMERWKKYILNHDSDVVKTHG